MLHPTSRPLPRPDPSSWYSVFPIIDSQQILFELMNSPRISQHFSQISELWDDLLSGREMSREARLFLPSSPLLLFGDEIVAGLGKQCLDHYQMVAFGGPINPSWGWAVSPFWLQNVHAEKGKVQPEKSSCFVNSFRWLTGGTCGCKALATLQSSPCIYVNWSLREGLNEDAEGICAGERVILGEIVLQNTCNFSGLDAGT